jgi:hypothetical protein
LDIKRARKHVSAIVLVKAKMCVTCSQCLIADVWKISENSLMLRRERKTSDRMIEREKEREKERKKERE